MRPLILVCISLFLSANSESLNKILFNGDYEFIDLTHQFDSNTVYWKGAKKFQFTQKTEGFVGRNHSWYAAYEFAAAEHGGTHLDAPFHFSPTGNRVGTIPLENLIVPLIIIDISSKVNGDPNFVLYKHHLDFMINDNNGKPCVLVFKFGWSKYFYEDKYLGYDKDTEKLNFPGLSTEVAEWITSSYKNVVGIGADVGSVDPGSSVDYPAHKIFANAGLYNMENVNLHRPIPDYGCTALIMPMKIKEGTGAPLRLVAICPKSLPVEF